MFAGALAGLGLQAATAAADPPVPLKTGAVQLPLSGLVIDVPAKPNVTFKLTSSWALNDDGDVYDGRDVIDEFETSGDKLIAGNWVMVGYFDAGDCDKVLDGEELQGAWRKDAKLWGADWKARGGVHDLGGSIGKTATVMLCQTNDDGRSLLLYRYLIDQPLDADRQTLLDRVEDSAILRETWKSYRAGRAGDVAALRDPAVKSRGGQAVRLTELVASGLVVQLPDDGYVWLNHEGDGSDILDRMAPALPDVSVEVANVEGATCDEALGSLPDRKPIRPRAAPAGWTVGDAMSADSLIELLICRPSRAGALMVGVIQEPGRTDIAHLFPLLGALAQAAGSP